MAIYLWWYEWRVLCGTVMREIVHWIWHYYIILMGSFVRVFFEEFIISLFYMIKETINHMSCSCSDIILLYVCTMLQLYSPSNCVSTSDCKDCLCHWNLPSLKWPMVKMYTIGVLILPSSESKCRLAANNRNTSLRSPRYYNLIFNLFSYSTLFYRHV